MPGRGWTATDVPDQTGRTVVVTGANTGLGFQVARVLAARGARLTIACRDLAKGQRAADELGDGTDFVRLDLSSLASVRQAAAEIGSRYEALDLLINNAGVMMTPQARTEDGFELQLGTNHLGHFALTGLLLDRMLTVPGARIVTVSSFMHRRGSIDFDDLMSEHRYNRTAAYGQSKLANLLFAYELQRRLAKAGARAIALAAHPGYASTGLTGNMPALMQAGSHAVEPFLAQSAEKGALPILRAATDPAAQGGEYYGPGNLLQTKGDPKRVNSSSKSRDTEVASRLWTESERLTGVTYTF
jgi:NAD(P)-dependent dehydrogenase (short-subunit alcohol dehydrogenase family)